VPKQNHPFALLLWALTLSACSGAQGMIGDAQSADAGSTPAADSGEGESERPSSPVVPPRDAAAPAADGGVDPDKDADNTGCGDGMLQTGEACDDGNDKPGDGCSADCTQRERDYVCPAPGQACVLMVVCGDGKIAGDEHCDDGNLTDGDGCSHECEVEQGYDCPTPGALCSAAKCGDHIIAGDEACEDDDDAPADGDGCSAHCRVEPGYVCEKAGEACRKTTCNDGKKEGSEACDDGNQIVGDGCTPFCEAEPDCSKGACSSRCGDGLLLPGGDEGCDDGNQADRDGCSSKCQIEAGYECPAAPANMSDVLRVPVTYRDFNSLPLGSDVRHPDFEIFQGSDVTPGLVQDMLGTDGKPVYGGHCDAAGAPYPEAPPMTGTCPYNQQLTTKANFDQWYRDTQGVNIMKVEQMALARDTSGVSYSIRNSAFFPWDGDAFGWPALGREDLIDGHDFGFTSEIHTYFEYQPDPKQAQTLTFSGDDDVWVFINRRLAVDIGGLHMATERSVTLDDPTASRLGLERGKIYEIALFQAERHNPDSNFNLTLEGFINRSSQCQPKCGDGKVVGRETCDDGKNDGSYGSCTSDCQRAAYCGDGKRDKDHEACDDGFNITTYGADGKPGCAPGCQRSAYCGDGQVDSTAGETCDDKDNKGGYGHCAPDCHLGPRCGDHEVQKDEGETCDDGNLVSGDGCSKACQTEEPS
jgi:fibro-slime domain-containing protein